MHQRGIIGTNRFGRVWTFETTTRWALDCEKKATLQVKLDEVDFPFEVFSSRFSLTFIESEVTIRATRLSVLIGFLSVSDEASRDLQSDIG
jgi:hypothetical protein